MPPYDGEATVEKVAINAVMAGCPAEALPVVLAAVEAARLEPQFALQGLLATTMPVRARPSWSAGRTRTGSGVN